MSSPPPSWPFALTALVIVLSGCGNRGGEAPSVAMDASTTPVPDGGCLRASDCSSGGHCDCGYLNINFAAAACDRAGTCIATRPSCEPARPDDILCEEDGGCPLGGTCGGFGYCTTSWCSALDASTEAASDASVADSGDDGGGD